MGDFTLFDAQERHTYIVDIRAASLCSALQNFNISSSKLSMKTYLPKNGFRVITALLIVCWILYKRVAIRNLSL